MPTPQIGAGISGILGVILIVLGLLQLGSCSGGWSLIFRRDSIIEHGKRSYGGVKCDCR
jgi:hypothetical protein